MSKGGRRWTRWLKQSADSRVRRRLVLPQPSVGWAMPTGVSEGHLPTQPPNSDATFFQKHPHRQARNILPSVGVPQPSQVHT